MSAHNYLTPTEAAARLGLTPAWLERDRIRKAPRIPFLKPSGERGKRGGRVLYLPSDVDAYLASVTYGR
jgi:hypothetical protein